MDVVILFVYFMHSYNIVRKCISDVISEAIVVYCKFIINTVVVVIVVVVVVVNIVICDKCC